MKRLVVLLALASCNAFGVSVAEFGAYPDDGIDDTVAIQNAVNSGGVIRFDNGVYDLSKSGAAWCIDISGSSVYLVGRKNTVLRLADNTPPSVRMFSSQSGPVSGFRARNLSLDGNKANQSPNEHRHGFFLSNASNVRLKNIRLHDFTGDGVYIHDGSSNIRIFGIDVRNNDRNGVTIGGSVNGVILAGSTLENNAAQQFDSEASTGDAVDDIVLWGNYFKSPSDFALTSGGTSGVYGRGWFVSNNHIESAGHAMRVIYADDIVISENTIISGDGPYSGIQAWGGNGSIVIEGNDIYTVNQGTNGGIAIIATGATRYTDTVIVENNIITSSGTGVSAPVDGSALRFQGSRYTTITDNQIVGDVYARPTVPMESFIMAGNEHSGRVFIQGEIPTLVLE